MSSSGAPNRGDDWTVISPDLTRHIDWKKLPMRGTIPDSTALGRNEGTADFGNITTLDESPRHAGYLAAGSDDGVIAVTRDGGRNWTRTEHFPGVPDTTYVSHVIWSNADDGTLYATMDGHRSNDFKPYVLKSTDFGQTWTSISSDLPAMGSVQVIREHPRQARLLFVGTEFGVFFTIDGGGHWTPLKSGLPGVPVWDLAIQPRVNDLVVATHGRGIFILDDIGPLEHLAEAKAAGSTWLFPIRDELLFQPDNSHNSGMGTRGFAGQNPEPGARIAYLIDALPRNATTSLTIVDASGTVVRRLPVDRHPGLHLVIWDMHAGPPLTGPLAATDTAPAPEGRGGGRGGRGGFGGGRGGFGGRGGPPAAATFPALPGTYRARLTITPSSGPATILERSFTLEKDPMVVLSDAQLKDLQHYRLAVAAVQLTMRQRAAEADTVQLRLADVRRAIADAKDSVPQAARDSMAELEKTMRDIVAQVGSAGRGGRGGRGGGGAGGRGGAALGGRGRGGRGIAAADSTASDSTARIEEPPPDAPTPPSERTVQSQLNTLTELLNVQFMPGMTQQQTLKALPAALTLQGKRIDQLRRVRLPALEAMLRAAGVQPGSRQ